MDYRRIYEAICRRGQYERKLDYSEIHHITPRCMGGSDDKSNLTTLTAKEHYIAHALLTKLYPNESKVQYAYVMMSMVNEHQQRKVSSRHYQKSMIIRSKLMTENNPMRKKDVVKKMSDTRKKLFAEGKLVNPMHCESAKKKLSEHMKKNNPMTRFPEKNHSVKRTVVHYDDGTVKEFAMKKDFMATLTGLTHMQKRYKIDKNDLKEFGIIKVERFGKTLACEG